jgi:hypothetical protein
VIRDSLPTRGIADNGIVQTSVVLNPIISTGSDFERANAEQWTAAMRNGEFEKAWRIGDRALAARIDYRERYIGFRAVWQGRPLSGRHILLRCWRGLGDTIQFIRYIPLLRPRVQSITAEANEILFPILAGIKEIDRLVPLREENPLRSEEADVIEIEVTELPFAFRTTLETIPNQVPYLRVDPAEIAKLPRSLNVGLCWEGGSWDPRRAIPLAAIRPLGDLPHIAFRHLQRGPSLTEISTSGLCFRNLEDNSPNLQNTARLVAALDLVISVDTMIAHLAGALAKPVWTLLHTDADWRWLRGRNDSPWYPTMRLFRQTIAGDWISVVSRVTDCLTELAKKKN